MKSWFKKLFGSLAEPILEPIPANETGVSLPALNWFIHVLINNVGYNEWIRMTAEEQKKYDATHPHNKGYPYKVVTHPIPPGKDIVLKDSTTHTISCDSVETRNMLIEMARAYDKMEKEYYYLCAMNASEPWHEISELKPISPASSIRGPRIFLVSSPELCYVNGGIALGMEDEGTWYVFLNGKKVEHKVTHYRRLPPHPLFKLPEYEDVKVEVERLRSYWKHEQ